MGRLEGKIALITGTRAAESRRRVDDVRAVWESPTMIVTVDSKRRLTVPAGITMAVKAGDHFLVDFDAEEDALVYRRIASKTDWLQVLKACPVSMDDLPPRRREYFRSKL